RDLPDRPARHLDAVGGIAVRKQRVRNHHDPELRRLAASDLAAPPATQRGADPLKGRRPQALAEHEALRDHDHAVLRHREAGAIFFRVVADDFPGWHDDALIDDGAADTRVAPDVHVFEHHRVFHMRPAVHEPPRAQDAVLDAAATDDAALTHQGVQHLALAFG